MSDEGDGFGEAWNGCVEFASVAIGPDVIENDLDKCGGEKTSWRTSIGRVVI